MLSSENGGQKLDSIEQINNGINTQKDISKFQDFEGYDEFLKTLDGRKDKKELLSILSDLSKSDDVVLYLEKNGFPPDEGGYENFKSKFKVNNVVDAIVQLEGEKQETVVEKQETVVEKQKLTKEELELDSNIKTFCESFKNLVNNPSIKSLPGFGDLIGELNKTAESGDFKRNKEIAEKVTIFLKDGNNLQTVLETAKKSGDTQTYNNILSSVTYFAQGNPELAQKLNKWNETIQKENKDYNETSVIRQVQTREFFGNKLEGIRSTGRGYELGDKEIETTTRPPSAYIKGEKGYRLETELPRIPKEYNEKRREWQKRRDTLKKDFEREKTSFDLKKSELKDFVKDFPEPRESWAEEKYQEMKKGLTVIEQNLSTIHEQIITLDAEMKQVLSQIEFGDRQERESKENEKRETLRFLSSIGFDAIPQSITDSVISQLNSNSGLRARLGFNGVIDLANGQLGFNSDNNINQNTSKEKAEFTKVFNKMIGSIDNNLIDAGAILNGTGNPVKDPLKLSVYLEENGYKNSGAAVGNMMENLSKSGVEGEKK